MNYQKAKDVLGVPGEVLVVERKARSELISEVRAIMSKYEREGCTKLGDIPEGEAKERLRDLLRAMGVKVDF